MSEPKHLKSKDESQLDRLLNFSDGVFAIAITLLVIEIRVPVLTIFTDKELWEHMSGMTLKFIGFLISFAVVGHYQVVHHRIFGYVQRCSTKLIWANLGFLLSVVILPFSSGLLGEYSAYLDMKLPYGVYVLNMAFTGIMNGYLWKVVNDPKEGLRTHSISRERVRMGMVLTAIVPVVFMISFLLSFVFPMVSRFIPILIPFILRYGVKGLEKQANLKEGHLHKSNLENIDHPA